MEATRIFNDTQAAELDNVHTLLQQFADYLEVTETLARVGAEREPSLSPSHALFAAIRDRLEGDDSDFLAQAMQAVRALRERLGVASI